MLTTEDGSASRGPSGEVAGQSPGPDTGADGDDHRHDLRRFTHAMLVAGGASAAAYATLLLGLFDRRIFANFYDLQARALLEGHFDVPRGSLGIEAFVVDGSHYLYFPPGPALLRMPVLAFTDHFDGRLTTISMLSAWAVTTVLLALLVWRVRTILRPGAHLGWWEAVGYGVLLVAGTAGSTVLFLGSVPWVYHEAYAWAIAMAVGSGFALLGLIQHPSTGSVVATGLFTTGAVLSRTTTGYAVAAAVLLTAVLLPRSENRPHDPHLWWKVYAAGLTPILVGMGINWAKFRHPFLFPIQDQVFTELNAHRREAIAANGGDLFSLNMIWSTAVNYFRPDGIRFTSVFPFITLPGEIPRSYGGGFIDQANRTGSVVNFMPLLFGLTVWGVITAFRKGADAGAKMLRLPLLGALAIPAGIMFYAYIAHRYTAEFVPLLLLGSTIGFVDLVRRLSDPVRPEHIDPDASALLYRRSRRRRVIVLSAMGTLACFSVAATMAITLNTRALANPGPVLQDYVSRQEAVSTWFGDPVLDNLEFSDTLTLDARVDELRVIGDCQALYLGAGDEFRPWAEVGVRPLSLTFTPEGTDGVARNSTVPLATFSGHESSELSLERSRRDGVRLTIQGAGGPFGTEYFDVAPGQSFTVSVATDNPQDYIITGPGGSELRVPKETYDFDWRWLPNVLVPTHLDAGQVRETGLELVGEDTPAIDVCERLVADGRD